MNEVRVAEFARAMQADLEANNVDLDKLFKCEVTGWRSYFDELQQNLGKDTMVRFFEETGKLKVPRSIVQQHCVHVAVTALMLAARAASLQEPS